MRQRVVIHLEAGIVDHVEVSDPEIDTDLIVIDHDIDGMDPSDDHELLGKPVQVYRFTSDEIRWLSQASEALCTKLYGEEAD